jgi:hypothetical protein
MMTTTPTRPEARRETLEDLCRSLAALVDAELTLTLRIEQLSDEPTRGILECVLRDHLVQAIVELRSLAMDLASSAVRAIAEEDALPGHPGPDVPKGDLCARTKT